MILILPKGTNTYSMMGNVVPQPTEDKLDHRLYIFRGVLSKNFARALDTIKPVILKSWPEEKTKP